MLDIKYIRENVELVKAAAKNKRFDVDIDRLIEVDEHRRQLIQESEQVRQRRNEISSDIRLASNEDRPKLVEEGKRLKLRSQELEEELAEVIKEFDDRMMMVPNVPLDEVPVGETDADNKVLRHVGDIRHFDFEPRDHEELGEILGILDKPNGIKIGGARSYLLRGAGALLELAVIRLAIDILIEDDFELIIGPLMVKPEALAGTGYFPYGMEDTYHIEKDGKWLIGTSEVFLVSIQADEILERDQMPRQLAGYSACFRREAGAAGKDTRGIYRVHQFTKVEQVVVIPADKELSRAYHERILGNAEKLLQRLELPYRVALACTGDIGLGQVLKHEVETWMPSREMFCETHSCSSLYDYQARRSGIRYREENGEIKYCYTLNNTMVASPRILIPILENYQNADGSVTVPEVLRPYMNGIEVIKPR